MTIQAQPAGEQPTPPTTPASPTPSPESVERAGFIAKLTEQRQLGEPALEAPTEVAPPAETTPPTEPSAAEKKRTEVREAMQRRHAETLERQRQAQERTASESRRVEQPPQQNSARFWAEVRRHPQGIPAALREHGWSTQDIARAMDELTSDSLAQGTVHAKSAAEEAMAEAKRANERADALERQRQQEQIWAQGQHENAQFYNLTRDADLYPRLARLDQANTIRTALFVADQLAQQGLPYDREHVAVETEAWLESLAPSPAPAASAAGLTTPPPAAASKPAVTPTPTPAATRPRQVVPDLAGEGATHTSAPLTEREERAQVLAHLRKQIRA